MSKLREQPRRIGGPPVDAIIGPPSRDLEELWTQRGASSFASDAVYTTIREAVMLRVLLPGVRLAEEDLARRFDVSRTPVREAILRLESEGLAIRLPRRGLVVAAVSREELLELYVVRASIDGLAARLAATNAREDQTLMLTLLNEQIGDALSAGDWAAMARLNLDFHEAICRLGQNSVLIELMTMMHDRVRRFPGTTFSVSGRADEALREHRDIVEAIKSRDGDAAEALARSHMTRATEIRMAMLFRGVGPGAE